MEWPPSFPAGGLGFQLKFSGWMKTFLSPLPQHSFPFVFPSLSTSLLVLHCAITLFH